MTGLEVLFLFLILIFLGVPLAVSMGATGLAYLLINQIPLETLAHRMMNQLNSVPLLAVALFLFVGNLMNISGVTNHLFAAAKLFVGKIRGGLAQVAVLANLVFAGISGAALADIGGLGNVEIKAMREQGYKDETSASLIATTATLGPIFPPSIPLVVYATIAEVSGVRILIAGIVPALIIAACLAVQIAFFARKYNFPKETRNLSWKEKVRIFTKAIPALLAPIILLAGLLMGFFSPTEVAAFTVFYAVFLGAVVYKELSWKQFFEMGRETVRATANIMFIIAAAAIFAWVLTVEQVPSQLTDLLLGISNNPIVLLMLVNVLLLIVGMFMESMAAILVLTPLLVPPLVQAGVDPIHLGLVMVFNLMIGLLTPPVGMSLYMVSIVTKVPFARMTKVIWPYLTPLLIALVMLTLWPQLSLWLPNLIFKR